MLIITRHANESVFIFKDGEVVAQMTVTRIRGNRAHLGWQADKSIEVSRDDALTEENKAAVARHLTRMQEQRTASLIGGAK